MKSGIFLNRFTAVLFALGCVAVGLGVRGFWESHDWATFLIILIFSLALSRFSFRLPGYSGTFTYNLDTVGIIFLLMYRNISECFIALLLDSLFLALRTHRGHLTRSVLFRVFANMGMFMICALCANFFLTNTHAWPLWIRSLGAFLLFDGINLALFIAIRYSLGDVDSYRAYPRMLWDIVGPVVICSAVLLLIRPDTWLHLIGSLLYASALLTCVILLCRRYESTAKRAEEMGLKYRVIADNTADLIVIIGPSLEITYASPSHFYVLGLRPEVMEGSPIERWVYDADVELLLEHLRASFVDRTPFTLHVRYVNDKAEVVPTEVSVAPVSSQNVKRFSLVMVSRDLRERLATEERMRKSEQLAVVGQLAAGVAHEIRNPLTAIKGFLQITTRKPGEIGRFAPIMRSELERIEVIINEFLVWSKPQFGERARHSLAAILQQVIRVMDAQARMNNVEIVLDVPDALPEVECDDKHLKQVLVNVVKNAIEAMPNGGDVFIRALVEGNDAVVMIDDEGEGIAEEHIGHIGEPFFTTKENGTGLGLMVSYKIIEDHGGSMDISRRAEGGTRVKIKLPLPVSAWLAPV